MAGLLEGLEKLGLKNLDNLNLYEEEKEKEQEVKREEVKVKEEEVPQDKEKDYLFSKTYDCPVCGEKFKDITVKANRARLVHMDRDLRPVHDEIEPLKYEAIVCPKCGYAALGRYFGTLARRPRQFARIFQALIMGTQKKRKPILWKRRSNVIRCVF